MRGFWVILLVVLAMLPLLLTLSSRGSWRGGFHKSAIQVVADAVPRKYKLLVGILYLALVIFAAGKVKGLF